MKKVIQAMKDELIGKEFVYKSKYGGQVISKIADIRTMHIITFDNETEKRLAKVIRKGSFSTPKADADESRKEIKFTAEKTEFSVISENGNSYNLNEVYIIK